MFKKSLLASVLGAVAFVSCEKENKIDTEKPVINIVKPTDKESATISAGEDLIISAKLTDNRGVASYKIEIHNAEDNHTHSYSVVPMHEEHNFSYTETKKIPELKEVVIARRIHIPQEISGKYHLGIFAIDTAGNETQKFIDLKIK